MSAIARRVKFRPGHFFNKAAAEYVRNASLEDIQPDDAITSCYYESFIKGSQSDDTVFRMEVPQAFRNVDVEVNRTASD